MMGDLIERIESCGFECEAGPLTMSRDWQNLKAELKQANAVVEAAELYLFIERDGRGNDRALAEKKLRDAIAAAKTDTR